MREIVFDTETTGLEPSQGHRIVEIGCVELFEHLPTGRSFQCYLNPERPVPQESQRVHGLSDAFLADKPLFSTIAGELLEFLDDAPLVIHNAPFDLKFINAELLRTNRPAIPAARAIDTLEIAKAKLPGAHYSLDELCRRFGVDLSGRAKHGALLDAELTAQVYLELVGGRQTRLRLVPENAAVAVTAGRPSAPPRPVALPPRLTAAELAAHAAFVASELGSEAVWEWSSASRAQA